MKKATYDHRTIEPHWQKVWEREGLYKAEDFSKKKKSYILIEFPYPSGERLHVGHARSYSAFDVIARKRRMQGENVLYPMGWDAFGLPAENYAVKTGIHPEITTKENIANARKQAKSWGLSFDWSREVNTTDPNYYRWTQWIFLQLFKKSLAYRAELPVNWCPSCKINLANEEVIDDKCERCGAQTSRRMQKQWLLRITKYAERLLKDLETVNYRSDIKLQQVNWIGKKEGINIKYQVSSLPAGKAGIKYQIECFTTRPDTNFGATFIVLAPEHPLVIKITTKEYQKEVENYIEKAKNKSELERIAEGRKKTGVFTGRYAINQLNNYKMPIWISDFVLMNVGTGAVVGVPGHDRRDFEFAKEFNLEIIRVVVGIDANKSKITNIEQVQEGEGTMINSEFLNGMDIHKATKKIMDYLVKKGWGERAVSYHLRDWVFSRQHYWGEPIPIVYCRRCLENLKLKTENLKLIEGIDYTVIDGEEYAIVPVPEKDLPVKLPYVEKYKPTETGESPLAGVKNWVNTKCPNCGGEARRETDTMPNWAGSSWYYLRYIDPKNDKELADFEKLKYWTPVDWYNGGLEHTTLHLLYSRFWHKFLFDIGVVPTSEPYAKRTSHGVVLGPDGHKMSKSRGNVVNPDEVVKNYGADTLRMYEMFMGPFEQMIVWDEGAMRGVRRFLDKIWNLQFRIQTCPTARRDSEFRIKNKKVVVQPRLHHVAKHCGQVAGHKTGVDQGRPLQILLNKLVKKVTDDIENLKFNTAIAGMMETLNQISNIKYQISNEEYKTFLLLLAPFAPHVTEELWQQVTDNRQPTTDNKFHSIHQEAWPVFDDSVVGDEEKEIVVQVNGKMRDVINIKYQTRLPDGQVSNIKNEVIKMAKKSEKVNRYLKDKQIKETIFVPGRLVNFVVE